MNILTFENDGPLLVASDYWQSETAAAGKLYVSINAGCFSACSSLRASTRSFPICAEKPNTSSSQCCQRDKWVDREYCLEWMVEDGSDTPWACHLSPGAVDRAPNHEDVGKEWRGSVWDFAKGRPHKCLERPAYYQLVPELPWLRKITG